MTVAKRGSVYWMYFMQDGVRVQQTTGCTNKRDAQDFEAAYKVKLRMGQVGLEPKRKPIPFKKAVEDFLTSLESEGTVRPNTKRAYMLTSKHLVEQFRTKQCDRITTEDIERYRQKRLNQRAERTKKNISPATVNRELATLRVIFNRLVRSNDLQKNPVSDIKFLKENTEAWRVISESEERLYLMACVPHLRDIAILMLECGCRPEELFRLERKNVNLDKRYIFVPNGKTKAARRQIPLTERAFKILDSRLKRSSGEYVFANPETGKPITGVKTAHRAAIRRSGVKAFRLYDLRHTFASRFIESTGDLVTLAALLGHSSIALVTRYAHPAEEHKVQAIRKMEYARAIAG